MKCVGRSTNCSLVVELGISKLNFEAKEIEIMPLCLNCLIDIIKAALEDGGTINDLTIVPWKSIPLGLQETLEQQYQEHRMESGHGPN